MRRVAEPAARVDFRRSRWIHNALLRHICETCGAEMLRPFLGGPEVRLHRQQLSPLVAVRIVAVIIDEHPNRAAFPENPKNILDSRGWVGPVIRRFNGYRM